jgi:hypothetical protein
MDMLKKANVMAAINVPAETELKKWQVARLFVGI